MHELSVCRGLIRQLEAIAQQHGANAVSRVHLQVGPLSGVVPELLAEAFAAASPGSIADGASLQLDSAPLRVKCEACGAESTASPNRLICADCGDWHTRLLSGDELLLADVELVMPEEKTAHV